MSMIGIFGTGGFSREVLPLVRAALEETNTFSAETKIVFVERDNRSRTAGHNYLPEQEFFSRSEKKYAVVPIADHSRRRAIEKEILKHGANLLSVRAKSAEVLGRCEIGPGEIICSNCVLTDNVNIGRMFHMNIFSYVAHDCVIGDFVTFAPAVKCNGNVIIEDDVYIGTGAIIRQGTSEKPLRICKGAVVGAGALVLSDVPAGVTVIGNPARPLDKRKQNV